MESWRSTWPMTRKAGLYPTDKCDDCLTPRKVPKARAFSKNNQSIGFLYHEEPRLGVVSGPLYFQLRLWLNETRKLQSLEFRTVYVFSDHSWSGNSSRNKGELGIFFIFVIVIYFMRTCHLNKFWVMRKVVDCFNLR